MKTSLPPAASLSDLQAAQTWAWLHQLNQQTAPATSHEALGRLHETVRLLLQVFEDKQLLRTQSLLEDTLVQALTAMQTLNMNPDSALARGLARLRGGDEPRRAFHIFSDRVEIRVHGESRGQWSLYSQGDYEGALKLARDLDCDIIHEDACQLGLFSAAQLLC
jgi:hypothetical protein